MSSRAVAGLAALLALGASCVRPSGAARVVYINADRALAAVVEEADHERGSPSTTVVLIPSPGMTNSGDAADVGYAEAATAMPGLVAVVGHPSSRASLLAAPIYGEAGVPFIVPTASSRRLRNIGPWTFQLAPDDEAEGAFLATFALDSLEVRRVTVFYQAADEYGTGLRDGVVRALERRGVEPADQVGILEDSDFPRRVAGSLRRAVPQAVVVAARTPEAVALARAIHERLPAVPLLLADGVADSAFVRAAGPRAAPSYVVAWWRSDDPDPASRAFVARFQRVAGHPPRPQEAMYYDALMLAAEAVREVGANRTAIRRYLGELGAARAPYRGITGSIAFTRDRPTNLVMTRLADGAVVMSAGR